MKSADASLRKLPCVAATWRFSSVAVDHMSKMLSSGASALDAVEEGIKLIELKDDEFTFVGKGGLPNAEGKLELDAAIMDSNRRYGAVMCLQNITHPISVARNIMENCIHNVLSGDGALKYALENGFTFTPYIMNDATKKEWKKFQSVQTATNSLSPLQTSSTNSNFEVVSTLVITDQHTEAAVEAEAVEAEAVEDSHDTIGVVCMDDEGALCVGTSTSGWKFCHPGRVGDSPLVGSGLYCDSYGGAVATGDGEEIMRTSLSFLVVECMRAGHSPQAACVLGIERLIEMCGRESVFGRERESEREGVEEREEECRDTREREKEGERERKMHPMLTVAVVAVSSTGEIGAASTLNAHNRHRGSDGFPMICWREREREREEESEEERERKSYWQVVEASIHGASF
eukprot:CAMPEP_0182424116 /NCGR_PEP_ID=MMETSP1167-20130531/10241_1 /TAXON_ID=2988 /ORGANISM="Mallomonas Sp, Strain CCMP3275" /LENGTH=402 /DNA_ID=CAMNT_0024603665 /DNA_START=58 /DNA_END=1266 /DNA_ORIENTATION=+